MQWPIKMDKIPLLHYDQRAQIVAVYLWNDFQKSR